MKVWHHHAFVLYTRVILEFSLAAGLMASVYEYRGKHCAVSSLVSCCRHCCLTVCGLASEPTVSAPRPAPSLVASQGSTYWQ